MDRATAAAAAAQGEQEKSDEVGLEFNFNSSSSSSSSAVAQSGAPLSAQGQEQRTGSGSGNGNGNGNPKPGEPETNVNLSFNNKGQGRLSGPATKTTKSKSKGKKVMEKGKEKDSHRMEMEQTDDEEDDDDDDDGDGDSEAMDVDEENESEASEEAGGSRSKRKGTLHSQISESQRQQLQRESATAISNSKDVEFDDSSELGSISSPAPSNQEQESHHAAKNASASAEQVDPTSANTASSKNKLSRNKKTNNNNAHAKTNKEKNKRGEGQELSGRADASNAESREEGIKRELREQAKKPVLKTNESDNFAGNRAAATAATAAATALTTNEAGVKEARREDEGVRERGKESAMVGASSSSSAAGGNNPSGNVNGQTISYSAEKIIGNGSFGVVFQATVVQTGEVVAIKKVLQDRRFKNRELQIMRRLSHPNIVHLKHCFYSKGSKPEELYLNLVLEYVPETVYRISRYYTKAGHRLPMIYVKLYVYQLCRSLAYIHALGICHRDIKPQNLLIDPETHALKLCDFGSAKALIPGEPNVSYICSRFYRAPELIFGSTNYSTAIDTWSLGCVSAELLLGHPLFPGDNGVEQLVEIVKILGTPTKEEISSMNENYQQFRFPQITKQPWSRIFPPSTPPALIDVTARMLAYKPGDRVSPLHACTHEAFDELRDPSTRLPNGAPLPPLFDFTDVELNIDPNLAEVLMQYQSTQSASASASSSSSSSSSSFE